jgi:hypothetical protein
MQIKANLLFGSNKKTGENILMYKGKRDFGLRLSEAVKSFYSTASFLDSETETRASYAPWAGLT